MQHPHPQEYSNSSVQKGRQQQQQLRLPSASSLLLRSLQFGTALVLAITLALVAYLTFYQTVRVNDLGGRHRVDLQYGHYRAPYASIQLPPGKYDQSNQPYDVQLELVVPLTPRNLAIGNFMVSLQLHAQDGATLINVSRPASLRQPDPSFFSSPLPHVPVPKPSTSVLLRPFEWVTYLIPNPLAWVLRRRLTERTSNKKFQPLETEHVIVPLVSHSALRPYRSTLRTIAVEVGRRDAHLQKGECRTSVGQEAKWDPEGELQVYESWLELRAHLTGLRYLLHYHPYLAFLVFFPLFVFVELSIAFLVWIGFVVSKDGSEALSSIAGKRPPPPPRPASRLYDTTEDEDSKVGIKHQDDEDDDEDLLTTDGSMTPSATASVTASASGNGTSYGEGEGEDFDRSSRSETARRLGARGMVDISGSTQREDEDESYGSGTEDGLESASQVGGQTRGGEMSEQVKDEEGDDMVTLGGVSLASSLGCHQPTTSRLTWVHVLQSETTRATGTSFGPSLAATSATTATGTSLSRVRSRLGATGGAVKQEDE
ncbi:BQ2448_224 [Microbotryum intermedium]|uniref:BQ2448_224 protein n=1 Tax=Microbotryum intermedium TaxID=269621 RepID=A0A238F7V2_9BASI|nr:BQ2448_224 [Microbotryum intermedium]